MIFDLYEQTGEFPYARGNALRGYPGPVSLIIEDGKRPKGKARWISDAKYKLEHVAARMLDEAARKGWDFEASELLPVFLVVEAFEAGWRRDERRLRECYDRLAGVNGRDERRVALLALFRAHRALTADELILQMGRIDPAFRKLRGNVKRVAEALSVIAPDAKGGAARTGALHALAELSVECEALGDGEEDRGYDAAVERSKKRFKAAKTRRNRSRRT
jgi:hypothetical protein